MKIRLFFFFLLFGFSVLDAQEIDPNTINAFYPDPLSSLDLTYVGGEDFFDDSFFEGTYEDKVISFSSITSEAILGVKKY